MGSTRRLRAFSALSAAFALAFASPDALAFHKKSYTPVYAAPAPTATYVVQQAPTAYFAQAPAATYAAPAPTGYYTQSAAPAPVQVQAQAPVQLIYPKAAAAPVAGSAPADGSDDNAVLSPTLRAALIVELRQSLGQSTMSADNPMSERVSDLREKGTASYQKLVGGDGELSAPQKDDLNAIVDQVVAEELNRPARQARAPYGSPYYATSPNVVTAGYYPAYAAPTLYLVQPVVPVQVYAPVQTQHHHLLHHNKY